MELFTQLFTKALEGQKIEVRFPDMEFDLSEKIESVSLATLHRIREIIMDDTLNDAECFRKIEEIVRTYEELGIHCGVRHDFG